MNAPAKALPAAGSFGAWWLASRPATLAAAIIPVAVGTALAYRQDGLHPWAALAALGGASALQIGANYANYVYDFKKGADTEDRVGPTRAAQAGLLSPRALTVGMAMAFVIATLFGVYLTWLAGPAIIAIGVASIVCAIAYTGGPYPLGYHGLGDVFVMLFFGFVAVAGTVFVQTGAPGLEAYLAALPVGGLATNILVVNNVRDRFTDREVGKRTLAVRLGKKGGLVEYTLFLVMAYGVPLFFAYRFGSFLPLLPLLTLPLGISLFRQLKGKEGPALNPVLAASAKLMTLHGLLFTVGIAVSRHF